MKTKYDEIHNKILQVEGNLIDDLQFTLRASYRLMDDSNSNKKPIKSKELKEIRELITRMYDRLEKFWKHEWRTFDGYTR